MTGGPAIEADGHIQVGIGGGDEVEVVRFEGQMDCFTPINASSDNSYMTYLIRNLIRCEMNAQRSSYLAGARPSRKFSRLGDITSKVTKA